MKAFIWISPHFPYTYYHFPKALKKNGFLVLGIGDEQYDNLHPELKESLQEYYRVGNMNDFSSMEEAIRYFQNKYGHIDYLESNNEYWLSNDAKLREIFGIKSGLLPNELSLYQHKSTMKDFYKKAGANIAPYIIVKDYDSLLKFANKVGFPLFIKPDIGVGAGSSYRLSSKEDLDSFYKEKDNNVIYICEQCLSGTIVSFDGVSDSHANVIFFTSNVFPPSVSDVKNSALDFFYYTVMKVDPHLEEIGKKVVKAFNIKNRFFHAEFFLLDKDIEGVGKKGEYVGLEVNMRTPGGYTPDMINYANSVDCYQIYADSMAFDSTNENLEREKYYCATASRRDQHSYFYTDEEILRTFGKEIAQYGRYPDVFSDIMGNRYFMAKFKTLEEVDVFHKFVDKKNPSHIEKSVGRKHSSTSTNICDTHVDGA